MLRCLLAGLATASAAVAVAASQEGRAAVAAPTFAYDRARPLDVRVASRSTRDGVTVSDLSFSIDGRARIGGDLLTPSPDGAPSAAILFVPGRRQTRRFFLAEARTAAKHGVVALAVDDRANGYPTFSAVDRATLVRRVVALRRSIDLLLSQPGVDAHRLAVVGHSDGAELAGILAGIDRRASSYVLMSGGGIWDRSGDPTYNDLVAGADADNYIGRAAPAALFFQSALSDQYVPRSDGRRYQQLASRPKTIRWYDADHMLNARARADRQAWLGVRLHLRLR